MSDGSNSRDADGRQIDARGFGSLICLLDARSDRWAGQVISCEK